MGLERDRPRLRLPTLLRRNRINGGGNFSALLGLDNGFDKAFILTVSVISICIKICCQNSVAICASATTLVCSLHCSLSLSVFLLWNSGD